MDEIKNEYAWYPLVYNKQFPIGNKVALSNIKDTKRNFKKFAYLFFF